MAAQAAHASWKERPHLTLIPEEMRPINHRFQVVLVGETAGEFARRAVESEFAEAYRPKGLRRSEGDEGEPEGHLVCFCPTGTATGELARLRLQPCCHFSDALPLTHDRATALNLVVCFLFWRAGADGGTQATSECIRDFQARVAEIAHAPAHLRPFAALLAFEVSEGQEQQLRDFAGRQHVGVAASFFAEASEEALAEALQSLCESVIRHQQGRPTWFGNLEGGDGADQRCTCAVQ
mmetsp:Transcript_1707/g.5129  ORF Transcript_1707/g.5129 Transcript_1707/m.5129 type:complete len:237 (-) Transcript_1707:7-717(-)